MSTIFSRLLSIRSIRDAYCKHIGEDDLGVQDRAKLKALILTQVDALVNNKHFIKV